MRILRNLLEGLGLSMAANRLQSVLHLLADRLSRERFAEDWRLTPRAASAALDKVHLMALHHLAQRLAALLPQYTASQASNFFCIGTAFRTTWLQGDILTPPPHLLPLVLDRLYHSVTVTLTIVVPDWPAQPWFNALALRSVSSQLLPFPTWVRPTDAALSTVRGPAFRIARTHLGVATGRTFRAAKRRSQPDIDFERFKRSLQPLAICIVA